jgi:RimJ/RimL family protein N-acetyltransferase
VIKCDDQEMLVEWLCERLELVPTAGIVAIGSTDQDGKLLGVAGYDNYTGSAIDMHMAGSAGWWNKSFLRYAFYYPFVELDCKITVAKVASSNELALDIDRRLGFKEVCVIPDAFPDGVGMHVMIMRRENCKWLGVRNGQESKESQSA